MTPLIATRLGRALQPFRLLIACETMVAAQAIHLRGDPTLSPFGQAAMSEIRKQVAPLNEDRSLGPDIEATAKVMDQLAEQAFFG